MYFRNPDMVAGFFKALSFPEWLVYPLATAKVLAVITLWVRPKKVLVEWAYAGLFYDAILAYVSHALAGHGYIGLSLYALLAILASRILYGYAFIIPKQDKA